MGSVITDVSKDIIQDLQNNYSIDLGRVKIPDDRVLVAFKDKDHAKSKIREIFIPSDSQNDKEYIRGIAVKMGKGEISKYTGEALPLDLNVMDEVIFKVWQLKEPFKASDSAEPDYKYCIIKYSDIDFIYTKEEV